MTKWGAGLIGLTGLMATFIVVISQDIHAATSGGARLELQDNGASEGYPSSLNLAKGLTCDPVGSRLDCEATIFTTPPADIYVAGDTAMGLMRGVEDRYVGTGDEEALSGTNGPWGTNTWIHPISSTMGGHLAFDGVDDTAVSASDPAAFEPSGDISFVIWLKPQLTDDREELIDDTAIGVFGKRDATTIQYQAYLGSGVGKRNGKMTWFFYSTAGATMTQTSEVIPAFDWTQVVYVIDDDAGGDTCKTYINAVLIQTDACTWSMGAAAGTFRLGSHDNGSGTAESFYMGRMDGFRLYANVLTQGEIDTLYASGDGVTCGSGKQTGLNVCYDVGSTSGTTVTEDGPGSDTLTLTAATTAATNASGWQNCATGYSACWHGDGTDDWIEVRDRDNLDPTEAWTIMGRYKPSQVTSAQPLIEKRDNVASKGGYGMWINASGNLVGYHYSGTGAESCTSAAALSAGTRYHLAVKYDSTANELRCYIDGTQSGSTATATGADYSSESPIALGGTARYDLSEKLANRDLESCTSNGESPPPSWTQSGASHVTCSTTSPYQGTYSAIVTWSSPTPRYAYQTISAASGATYRFEVWAKNASVTTGVLRVATAAGGSAGTTRCSDTQSVTATWELLTCDYKAVATETLYMNLVGTTSVDQQFDVASAKALSGPTAHTQMDDVAMFDAALADGTISSIAGSGTPLVGNETNIQGLWHFDDADGDLLVQSVTQPNLGSDSATCTSSGDPCLTILGGYEKAARLFNGSSVIHVAPGIYPEFVDLRGFSPAESATITIRGQFGQPNTFYAEGSDVATISGTSSGSNTANHPASTYSLFKDATTSPFQPYMAEGWLQITGPSGNGKDGYCTDQGAGFNYKNWYGAGKIISTSQIAVPTYWDMCGTPGSSATYKLYEQATGVVIAAGHVRDYGIRVRDSAGLKFQKLAVRGARLQNIIVTHASTDEWSVITSVDAEYVAFQTDAQASVETISKVNFSDNYAGFNHWSSSAGTVTDSIMNRNLNGGYGSYFNANIRGIGPLLLAENGYAGVDVELGGHSFGMTGIRVECQSNPNAVGIRVSEKTNATLIGPVSVAPGSGNCQTNIAVNAGSSLTAYPLIRGTASDIHLSGASVAALYVDGYSACNYCGGWTYTGNTVNQRTGVGGVINSTSTYPLKHDVQTLKDTFVLGTTTTGDVGDLGWSFTNGTVVDNTTLGDPGIAEFRPTVHATNQSLFCLEACGTLLFLGDDTYIWTHRLFEGPTGSTTNMTYGLQTNAADPAQQAVFQTCTVAVASDDCTTTGETQWYTVTENASGRTRKATGISNAQYIWRTFQIERAATTVKFYIDGVLVTTHDSTATPTEYLPNAGVQPIMRVHTTSGAATYLYNESFRVTFVGSSQ